MMGLVLEPRYQGERAGTAGYSVKTEKRAGILRPEDLNGVGRTPMGVSSTLGILHEVSREWPEIFELHVKLNVDSELDERNVGWLEELSRACGWDLGDVVEEVGNLNVDPSERVYRYKSLFENYYSRALEYKERGDTRQAGEKLWGAILALIKLYASLKGVPVIHWSRGKVDNFITDNVEARYKKLFRDLVDKAHVLHEHFYEGHLNPKSFNERWEELLKLVERARTIVFKHLPQPR
jgi:hypothetical protein